MGLMDKVKNLFTEEVVEEPVKSEVIQVEIPAPEIKKEEVEITDNNLVRNEEKNNVPIFFDDEDFKELEKTAPVPKSSYLKEKIPPIKPKEESKKRFKPTPIISPVYGVLNKNYHKEDITNKRSTTYDEAARDLDEVRRKAYGTLEDDLETTLFGTSSILFNEEIAETEEIEEVDLGTTLFDELTTDDILDMTAKIEEPKLSRLDKEETPIGENELFNLIDSMYEKGDEE